MTRFSVPPLIDCLIAHRSKYPRDCFGKLTNDELNDELVTAGSSIHGGGADAIHGRAHAWFASMEFGRRGIAPRFQPGLGTVPNNPKTQLEAVRKADAIYLDLLWLSLQHPRSRLSRTWRPVLGLAAASFVPPPAVERPRTAPVFEELEFFDHPVDGAIELEPPRGRKGIHVSTWMLLHQRAPATPEEEDAVRANEAATAAFAPPPPTEAVRLYLEEYDLREAFGGAYAIAKRRTSVGHKARIIGLTPAQQAGFRVLCSKAVRDRIKQTNLATPRFRKANEDLERAQLTEELIERRVTYWRAWKIAGGAKRWSMAAEVYHSMTGKAVTRQGMKDMIDRMATAGVLHRRLRKAR